MGKRVLISTGGTGGHIFPAIALAQQLLAEDPSCQIMFVGGNLSNNKYFDRETYDFCDISCGSFVSKNPSKMLLSLSRIARGVWQSQKIIKAFSPDVVVGFGSYYAFPPLVAARLLSVPLVLHEANSIPGKTIKFMSRWATLTGVHFPETLHLLSGNVVEVGMPLRTGFQRWSATLEQARGYFELDAKRMTILIFGGSQGSRAINESVTEALCRLKGLSFQVIHVVGEPTTVKKIAEGYAKCGIDACVKTFESRMDLAWQAADCVVSRAGAGTIAEMIEFEVPGILIPYPHAADGHQDHNANFVESTVGGGLKLLEKDVTVERLVATLKAMIDPSEDILNGMRKAIRDYKLRSRTKDLVTIVMQLEKE
jgi:UDP-N-acetylglucosamine--N-acetylmuramyl-(pentapeptide) pyrophosphoryl-undecaprenol N-acetylglucosamine transferase